MVVLLIVLIAIVGGLVLQSQENEKKPAKTKNTITEKERAKSVKRWAEAPFLIYEDIKPKKPRAKKTRKKRQGKG